MMIVKRMRLHGWRDGKDPVECMVEIEIDEEALARDLGNRAFRNKTKVSRAQAGVIKCSVRPCEVVK